MTTTETISRLCGTVGVSGEEFSAAETAAELLRAYTDDVSVDAFGNVTGRLKSQNPEAPTILLDAHIDQIGMIVTHIEDSGFVRVSSCGGIDRRLVLAQQLTVWGKKPLTGLVATKPPHLTGDERSNVPEVSGIALDLGLPAEQVKELVSLGDRVSMTGPCTELPGGRLTSASLDDRSGVASLLHALRLLQGKELPYHVTAVFSSQEETGGPGAHIAAVREHPDEAIAVDVSFAVQEGLTDVTAKLGDGAMIGIAPALNRGMFDELLALAKEKNIPYTVEVMGGHTGTNSEKIVSAGTGVRTALISIPLKYMHTPVETIEVTDVEAVGALIAAYILR